jgi:hypothetical protein
VRRFVAIAVVVAASCLAGCSLRRGLTLTPEEADLAACANAALVPVEDLNTDEVDCDASGSTLVFPDGTELEMGILAGSGNRQDGLPGPKYAYVNVGRFGIVAAQSKAGCVDSVLWGSTEGTKRVLEAFGNEWPCEDR